MVLSLMMVATVVAVFAATSRIVHHANYDVAHKIRYYSIIICNLLHNVYDDVCN